MGELVDCADAVLRQTIPETTKARVIAQAMSSNMAFGTADMLLSESVLVRVLARILPLLWRPGICFSCFRCTDANRAKVLLREKTELGHHSETKWYFDKKSQKSYRFESHTA